MENIMENTMENAMENTVEEAVENAMGNAEGAVEADGCPGGEDRAAEADTDGTVEVPADVEGAATEGTDEGAAQAVESVGCGEVAEGGNRFESEEFRAMLAEAEQRGYLRGRNESIEQLMRQPGMMEPLAVAEEGATIPDDNPPQVLSRIRPSIWDAV